MPRLVLVLMPVPVSVPVPVPVIVFMGRGVTKAGGDGDGDGDGDGAGSGGEAAGGGLDLSIVEGEEVSGVVLSTLVDRRPELRRELSILRQALLLEEAGGAGGAGEETGELQVGARVAPLRCPVVPLSRYRVVAHHGSKCYGSRVSTRHAPPQGVLVPDRALLTPESVLMSGCRLFLRASG